MTFAQRRNRLTTHFSESIPVVKRHLTVRGSIDSSLQGRISVESERVVASVSTDNATFIFKGQ